MEIKKINRETIKEAVKILKNGGIVVYPTDTLYGLGADASNKKAVQKIYEIKGRDFQKPLSVLVKNFEAAVELAVFDKRSRATFKTVFPGPFTLIIQKKKNVSNVITAGQNTIGIRISKNKTAQALVAGLKAPLIATSANLAGEDTPKSAQGIYEMFRKEMNQPDLILDGGYLRGKGSTIIDLSGESIKILREGAKKNIKNLLKK